MKGRRRAALVGVSFACCAAPKEQRDGLPDPSDASGSIVVSNTTSAATSPADPSSSVSPPGGFVTRVLETAFYAEGSAVADVNADGALDLIAGPLWYEGPSFTTRHTYADAPTFTPDEYSAYFLVFSDDLNADGAADLIVIAGPNGETGNGGPNARWFENPAGAGAESPWQAHSISDMTLSNESPIFADVTGDGVSELVFMSDQRLGYLTRSPDPYEFWTFTPISDALFATPFVHGLGVGDVNGDGRADVVERSGWWEQPSEAGSWIRHEVDFALGGQGGAQMLVMDVDADGDADVVSSLNAHGYGLAWFEQQGDAFTAHMLLDTTTQPGNVSQLHALAAGDVDSDGDSDFVVGKRYYAHPSSAPDPGTTDPALVYWFERTSDPTQRFVPHLVHDDSGVGCGFIVRDVNADGKVDIFSTNKRGTFLHLRQ